jgi:NADH-quinone oxidoreductase subunit K
MISLAQLLTLSGVVFAIAVAGMFLNRKNLILLLMCVELLLLAANFNFIAFSRSLGDIRGQIFVFFVLTVAAAESAIGLAILVVLFREKRSINVEDLNKMKG